MSTSTQAPDWLRRYGNLQGYQWRSTTIDGRPAFCRPLGLVEFSFDTDGRHYEGRADMNVCLKVEFNTTLSKTQLRERLILAWTRLRCQHLLLQSRTLRDASNLLAPQGLHFAVNIPQDFERAHGDAEKQMVFLEDYYGSVDWKEFYHHCQNVKRVVDPDVALAKVLVLPAVVEDGRRIQRFQFVGGHQIWDGLSSYVWMRDFVHCLNETPAKLQLLISASIQPGTLQKHLPLPQEALYPPIEGNLARQRWFWAIVRILRHVRKPLPAGFSNPLHGRTRKAAVRLKSKYDAVLDYGILPPLNTRTLHVAIPADSAKHLSHLCKSTFTTLGAGIFALCALTMQEFHLLHQPSSTSSSTTSPAFITGFPLNPRSFFNHHTDPNSMMLAFSDGISLPLLPSHLPLPSRLRLLTRLAHRQLTSYQKRARPKGEDAKRQNLSARGAGLVLANQYLYSLERAESVLSVGQRGGFVEGGTVQGLYPAKQNPTMQTCGVSSVGRRDALIGRGMYDVDIPIGGDAGKDLVADFRDLTASVRAREGEFLVGIGGAEGGLFAAVSVDESVIDEGEMEAWKRRFETCLEELAEEEKSRL